MGMTQQPAATNPRPLHAAEAPGQPVDRLPQRDPGNPQRVVPAATPAVGQRSRLHRFSAACARFHPQLQKFCTTDQATAKQAVQTLIDHIQGKDKPHVAGVAKTMAKAFLNLYQQKLQMAGNLVQATLLQTWISQLQQFLAIVKKRVMSIENGQASEPTACRSDSTPAPQPGFVRLARRIPRPWTTNGLLTVMILVAGLGFGRQVPLVGRRSPRAQNAVGHALGRRRPGRSVATPRPPVRRSALVARPANDRGRSAAAAAALLADCRLRAPVGPVHTGRRTR